MLRCLEIKEAWNEVKIALVIMQNIESQKMKMQGYKLEPN